MTRQRTPGVDINACYGYVNVVMLEADSLATYQPGRSRPAACAATTSLSSLRRHLALYRVDQAVRTGNARAGGTIEPLPQGWGKPLIDNGRDIVAKLVEAWGSGRQFDAILIGVAGLKYH